MKKKNFSLKCGVDGCSPKTIFLPFIVFVVIADFVVLFVIVFLSDMVT